MAIKYFCDKCDREVKNLLCIKFDPARFKPELVYVCRDCYLRIANYATFKEKKEIKND